MGTEMSDRELLLYALGEMKHFCVLDRAVRKIEAALAAQQKAEPLTEVQEAGERLHAFMSWLELSDDDRVADDLRTVIEHARNAAPPIDPEGIRLLREARDSVAAEVEQNEAALGHQLMHRQQPSIDLLAAIDAYLAKYHSGPVVGAP